MAQKDLPGYRKTGPVYIVNNAAGTQSVLSVAEYTSATDSSWHYFLRLHTVKDNRELNRKKIAVTHGRQLEPAQLIGRLGNIFYVVTDSLVGYDVHTLEPVVTEATVIAANPFMKDNISRQHNNYLLDEAAGVLYVRAENDDRYKLYPGAAILYPDNGNNEPAPEEYSYEINANYRLYDRYTIKDALTCVDTADNNLYILGSEKETGHLLSYFGTAIFPEREEIRQLTIVPYHADGEKPDYNTNQPKTKEDSYLKGGFLQNKFCTTAWKSKQGERVILFQTNTKKQILCVALIDKNGIENWRTEIGRAANTFIDYLVGEGNLLLWLNYPNIKNNHFETGVVNVDLVNGSINSYE